MQSTSTEPRLRPDQRVSSSPATRALRLLRGTEACTTASFADTGIVIRSTRLSAQCVFTKIVESKPSLSRSLVGTDSDLTMINGLSRARLGRRWNRSGSGDDGQPCRSHPRVVVSTARQARGRDSTDLVLTVTECFERKKSMKIRRVLRRRPFDLSPPTARRSQHGAGSTRDDGFLPIDAERQYRASPAERGAGSSSTYCKARDSSAPTTR